MTVGRMKRSSDTLTMFTRSDKLINVKGRKCLEIKLEQTS